MRVAAARCGGSQQRQPRERRPARRAALLEGILRDKRVATLDQPRPERMRRERRLDDDFANATLPSGAAGYLND